MGNGGTSRRHQARPRTLYSVHMFHALPYGNFSATREQARDTVLVLGLFHVQGSNVLHFQPDLTIAETTQELRIERALISSLAPSHHSVGKTWRFSILKSVAETHS